MNLTLRIATLTLMTSSLSCVAQKWNVGIEAGYVNNTLAVEEYNATARNGFKIGVDVEYAFRNNLTLESGLSYIRKGATLNGENIHNTGISRIKYSEMDYLQLPVMMGYKFDVCNGFNIKPEIGGYCAVGVNGDSFVIGHNTFNQPYEARVSTFSAPEISDGNIPYRPTHRFDSGLAFALNLTYRHLTLKAEYDLGLTTATYYGNGQQRTFSISLAYWVF